MSAKQTSQPLPPLLVTGIHRSGTTWVGAMLAASGKYAYVSEPLNVWHRRGVFNVPVERWYTYICADNEQDYLPALRDSLRLRYRLGAELVRLRSLKDVGRMCRDIWRFGYGHLAGQSPLLKDPFAVFSAPWFADRLGCQVVITVRHPAAFVSSLIRQQWSFNFNDLLDQPLLVRDWLSPLEAEMRQMQATQGDPLARACLLWRLVYHVVQQYRQQGQPFHILRHEDLSLQPVAQFRQLYQALGIPFTPQAERRIRQATGADNPSELAEDNIHSVKLNSRANIKNWQKRLTAEEIKRVRSLTADVAAHFYNDEDWA
jgi:hypothetical protein